ncbi:MAG: hypothetical protein U1E36_06365 [Rickettsiales bacterium]
MKTALTFLLLTLSAHAWAQTPAAVPGYNPDPEEPYTAPDTIGIKEEACPTPPASTSNRMACTMMACMDGLSIHIDTNYRWKPGHYQFVFDADGKAATCEGSLPLRDCESNSLTCTSSWMQITESGCALPKDNQGFGDIWINGWPKRLTVTISRDGKTLASQNLTPSYHSSQPNGGGCQPTCCQAAMEIKLAP